MFTQSQLAAALANRDRTKRHEQRMKTDHAYCNMVEREAREYEELCAIYGDMDRGD